MDAKTRLPLKCSIKFFDLSCMLSLAFEEEPCLGTENVRNNVYVILHIEYFQKLSACADFNQKKEKKRKENILPPCCVPRRCWG